MATSLASAAAPLATDRASAAGVRRFGPFVLRRLLGKSSLTMAWLAYDQRVQLEVMLMLPRAAIGDAAEVAKWLDAARRMARLQHPQLAPVLDLGAYEAWPYVVCERPDGAVTLAEWMAARPSTEPCDVAQWCADALEGLAYVHEAGMSHGDIGLHSLMLDKSGHVQVWGQGLIHGCAAVDGDPADAQQRQHQRADAERDVLAMGLVMHGVLAHAPALGEPDLPAAMGRLERDILRLPWDLPQPVPEALRAIVNRATDRHPQRRYLNARSLLRALQGWRQVHGAQEQGGALALLVDRLPQLGHLPARPGLAQRVKQLAGMEQQPLEQIVDLVLQDPALSFELLRVVNSAQFGAHQDGSVGTVRRAMQLIGVQGVRRAASALRAWPGPLRGGQVQRLERALQRACLAGHAAELLTPAGIEPEGCLLAAQLQHLGRLLVLYHFPDDAVQMQGLMSPAPGPGAEAAVVPGMTESAAAMAVLGVDLRGLATAVVRHWGLDAGMQAMICPLPRDKVVYSPKTVEGWIGLIASCANELVDTSMMPTTIRAQAQARVTSRYAKTLGYSAEDLASVLLDARTRLAAHLAVSADRP
ncbi:MAG: serine/threonine protein kinase [Leptothrix sp. (in: b-proteobacteria)]